MTELTKAEREVLAISVLKGARKRIAPAYKWIKGAEIKTKAYGREEVSRDRMPGPNAPDLDGSFCAFGAIKYEAYRRGLPDEVIVRATKKLVDAIANHPKANHFDRTYANDLLNPYPIFQFNDKLAKKAEVLEVFDQASGVE